MVEKYKAISLFILGLDSIAIFIFAFGHGFSCTLYKGKAAQRSESFPMVKSKQDI